MGDADLPADAEEPVRFPAEEPAVLARSAAVGFAAGAVGVGALVAVGWTVRSASELVFPLGALAFGFGLTSWASALLFGGTLDAAGEQLDLDRRWTSKDSRDAMSVVAVAGAATMLGASVATVALTAV